MFIRRRVIRRLVTPDVPPVHDLSLLSASLQKALRALEAALADVPRHDRFLARALREARDALQDRAVVPPEPVEVEHVTYTVVRSFRMRGQPRQETLASLGEHATIADALEDARRTGPPERVAKLEALAERWDAEKKGENQ